MFSCDKIKNIDCILSCSQSFDQYNYNLVVFFCTRIYFPYRPSGFFFKQLLENFQKSFPKLTFPPLPDRGDFDLKDVLQSPYFFN